MSNPFPEVPSNGLELPSEETKKEFHELTIAVAVKDKDQEQYVGLTDERGIYCTTNWTYRRKGLMVQTTICGSEITIDQQGTKWQVDVDYELTQEGDVLRRIRTEWVSDGNTPPNLDLDEEEQAALDADMKAQADEAVIESAAWHLMTPDEKLAHIIDSGHTERAEAEEMNATMPVTEQELQTVIQLLKEAHEKVKDLPDHEGKTIEPEKILEAHATPADFRDLNGISSYADRVLFGYENRNPEEEWQKEEKVELPEGGAIIIDFDILERHTIEITELPENKSTSSTYLIRYEIDGIRGLKSSCKLENGSVVEIVAGSTSPITKFDCEHLEDLLRAALRHKYSD